VILLTHLGFRRTLSPEAVASLPLKLPAHPLFSILGVVALIAIAITTFFVDGLRNSVPTFAVFLLVMSVMYLRARRKAV
jgi:L-asparagine transporter-like permease